MSNIILYDRNIRMCEAWEEYFDYLDVLIKNDYFDNIIADYIVTAGNSYGVMSGGIDLAVRNYFGQKIQDKIQHELFFHQKRILPVGELLIVETGNITKPYLVYAPTMEYPQRITSDVIYKVMYKILEECYDKAGTLAICGLGTATGGIEYGEAAHTMYESYNDYIKTRKRDI